MVPQSKGKIFLADERGHTELEWFRSYNTFNFGHYRHPHKEPFGALYILNEDTLAGGSNISLQAEEDSDIILLSVVGTITYSDSLGNAGIVKVGQLVVLDAPKGMSVRIGNPYEDDLVKFLQWWVRVPSKTRLVTPAVFSFDLAGTGGGLTPMVTARHDGAVLFHHAAIGRLGGREEAVYKTIAAGNGLFAFVIQGEVEVQYRLLQAGDGLALWDLAEIEMEALSSEAIILLMEVPV
jgi:redox-sensitive bicupin YhaK (pirin superfamily)